MAEDNHGQIISLQIAADKSSKAFNDLTAIQNKSNRAQDQIENQYCETKLKITKDWLVLDTQMAHDQAALGREEL